LEKINAGGVMKRSVISIIVAALVFAVLIMLIATQVYGDRKDEILKKIEELSKEAERTTDINRLMEISKEIMRLTQELDSLGFGGAGEYHGVGGIPSIPLIGGGTAEEAIEGEFQAINTAWKAFQQSATYGKPTSETRETTLPQAMKFKGYIIVDGKDQTAPYRGWIWVKLHYNVKESFAGIITINHYYDPKKGKFTGEKDYLIHAYSTDIEVMNVGGRECVEASAGLPGRCIKWEEFTTYEIDEGESYPGMHHHVLMGNSEEGKMKIEVDSPGIVFKSANGRISRRLGCFGVDLILSKAEFEQFMEKGKFQRKKNVAVEGDASPGCKMGSKIILYLEMETPRCGIEILGDKEGIFDCKVDGGQGFDITLEAKLYKGTPASYQWKIAEGGDIVKFEPDETTKRQAKLMPISYSKVRDDVVVEVEIKDTKGKVCVASCSLTVKKPSSLSRLTDKEIENLGYVPYKDYKKMYQEGKPDSTEIGNSKLPLIDGYKRVIVYQVMDQFGFPITEEMPTKEERWIEIDGKRINIPTEDESDGKGLKIPVYPNKPGCPTITMFSGHGITEKGGKLVDDIGIAYPQGSSGMPKGLDIQIHQKNSIHDCFVGYVLQHYKEKDVTATYTEP
jgi:hypothetical protein